jgi:glutamate dehydrogenase (NADP+)
MCPPATLAWATRDRFLFASTPAHEFAGVPTGGLAWGAHSSRSHRYGCVYFANEMPKTRKETPKARPPGLRQRNVSQYTVEKLISPPVTVSDSDGVVYDPDGIDREAAFVMDLKNTGVNASATILISTRRPCRPCGNFTTRCGNIKADCAPERHTERNQRQDATNPINNGASWLPRREHAEHASHQAVLKPSFHGPAKQPTLVELTSVSNAEQHALADPRGSDDRPHKIMIAIHKNCYETAEMYGTPGNLVNGANIGGFLKVANAMLDQGLV